MNKRQNTIKIYWFTFFYIYPLIAFAGQIDSRLDSLDLVIENTEDDSLKAEILLELASISKKGNFKRGLQYAFQALEHANKTNSLILRNKIIVTTGSSLFQMGLFDQAVFWYIKQLQLGKDFGDASIIGKAYFNLGSVYLILEDYTLAEENYDKAISYLNRYQNETGEALSLVEQVIIYNAIGLVYSGLNRFDEASDFFQKAMSLTNNNPQQHYFYSQVSNNYADLLFKQGNIDEAKSLLEEIIFIEKTNQNAKGLIVSLLYLSKVENAYGLFDKSKSSLLEALAVADTLPGFSDKKHLSSSLSEVYSALGRPDSSLYYLSMSLAYEDSLSIQKAKEELLKSQLQSQFEEYERELLKKHEMTENIFIVSVILLGLIIVVIGIFYSEIKKRFLGITETYRKLVHRHKVTANLNEKLIAELELKKQEIIFSDIQSVKNNELLEELSKRVSFNVKEKNTSHEVKKLLDDFKSSVGNKTWSEFEVRFKQIEGKFYRDLITAYPSLTMNERRLAAFLKLQLTSKEICSITGQSTRAVELGRTRLRKKLGLTNSDQNLYDFFLKFGSENDGIDHLQL